MKHRVCEAAPKEATRARADEVKPRFPMRRPSDPRRRWAGRKNGSTTWDGDLSCHAIVGRRLACAASRAVNGRKSVHAALAWDPPSGVPAESAPCVSRETERLPVCARRVRFVTSATREVRTSKSSHARCWCRLRDATRWWAASVACVIRRHLQRGVSRETSFG